MSYCEHFDENEITSREIKTNVNVAIISAKLKQTFVLTSQNNCNIKQVFIYCNSYVPHTYINWCSFEFKRGLKNCV